MSPDPDPPVHVNGQGEKRPPVTKAGAEPDRRNRRVAGMDLFRLLVVSLSAVGVLVAALLWATGHGTAALRVLAGDVLAIVVALISAG